MYNEALTWSRQILWYTLHRAVAVREDITQLSEAAPLHDLRNIDNLVLDWMRQGEREATEQEQRGLKN